MFYEFSIQYDDQPFLLLTKTPISDILYFNVNHAYPNWIPPNYLRMLSKPNTDTNTNTIDSISNEKSKPKISNIINNAKPITSTFLTFSNDSQSSPSLSSSSSSTSSSSTSSSSSSSSSSDFAFQYHRYIHLAHSYLDSYLPSDISVSPQDSLAAATIKILTPFVPQGKWTTGSTPPAPNEFFYRHFPKQSTDFDNDYHNRNPGIFWGWFHLTRWLPDLIQKILFPLDDVVYNNKLHEFKNNDTNDNNNNNNNNLIDDSSYTKKARKLMGKQTPTLLECQLCENFNGMMIWNRQNEWYCLYKNKAQILIDDQNNNNNNNNETNDINDKRFFSSFNDFLDWQINNSKKLMNLERMAYNASNMKEMEEIESQINELKNIKKQKDKFTADNIVSVRG